MFPLFRKYILFGYTYDVIVGESGYSCSYLIKQFHQYLLQEPPCCIFPKTLSRETFLLVDGLWLKRWYVMMVYRRSKDLAILHLSVAGKEAKGRLLMI